MNYNEFVFAMQRLLNYEASNTEFLDIVPRMIDYADQRIYIDFDFLATWGAQTTTMTASNRNVVLPSSTVVCQSLNVITPASATNPDLGKRVPLYRTSIDYINAVYPLSSNPTVPNNYAIIGTPTNTGGVISAGTYNILLAPTPDQAYTLEVIGTVRPSPLSPTNPNTFISVNMPELYIAAAMIFGAAYEQNFGSSAENPQLAQSWENQYNLLKQTTMIEELRKKAASVSWSSYLPTPPANVERERTNVAPQA